MSAKILYFPGVSPVVRNTATLFGVRVLSSLREMVRCLARRHRADRCFAIAMRIASLGYGNGEAQSHLDNAKDELYAAARAIGSKTCSGPPTLHVVRAQAKKMKIGL